MRRLTASFLLLFFPSGIAFAQASRQEGCEIPVAVTKLNNSGTAEPGKEFVTRLKASDFVVRVGGHAVTVSDESLDEGSKRIAIVLDASKPISTESWKLETSIALSLLEFARPEDKLSLLVFGDAIEILDFATARESLKQRLQDLFANRPLSAAKGDKVYDALLRASDIFGAPQFGDAIFFIGGERDSRSQANLDRVRTTLLQRRVRFFGILLTVPMRAGSSAGGRPLLFTANPDLANLLQLSKETGGYLSFPDTGSWGEQEMKFNKAGLRSAYLTIIALHRLRLSVANVTKPVDLLVELGRNARSAIGNTYLHFPRVLLPCVPSSL